MELESAYLSVVIDDTTGRILSLRDRISGSDHLADQGGASLFRLLVPTERWDSRYVDATQQHCTIAEAEEGCALVYSSLRAIDGEQLAISLRITIGFSGDGQELRLAMAVSNDSSGTITEVWFPMLGGWTGYGGPGHDTLNSGTTLEKATDPYTPNLSSAWFSAWTTIWRMRQRWALRYPFPTALPWLDISGDGRGLSLLNYMTRPELGGFAAENIRGHDGGMCLVFGWFSNPEVKPSTRWRSAPFGVSVHRGDWRATAARYREWLRSWWQPATAPNRLRQALAIENVIFRGFDGQPVRPLSAIGSIARAGKKFGIRDLCVWDYWMLGLYGRTNPGDPSSYAADEWSDLCSGIASARADGVSVSALVNHRLLAPRSDFMIRGDGAKALLLNRDGAPRQEVYGTTSHAAETLAAWRGPSALIACQRSADYRHWADRNMDRLLDAGFNAMFIDQAVEWAPCFSTEHGHRTPGDTHEAAIEWQMAFKARLKKLHPDGYITGEHSDPFVAQSADLIWHWAWSHGRPDVIAYTLPGVLQSWVTDRSWRDAQEGFLRAFLLQLTSRGLEETIEETAPVFASYIEALARLRASTAHLTTFATFANEDDVICDGAQARRFERSDGTTALILANGEETPCAVRATLPRRREHAHTSRVYHLDGQQIERHVGGLDEMTIELRLPARGVAVWEIPVAQ